MKALKSPLEISLLFVALLTPLVASAERQSDKGKIQSSKAGVPVSVTNTEKNAVPVRVVDARRESITHLNVNVREMVNLQSLCISPDNSLVNKFYYDRNEGLPFSIPEGYSFVVTDIFANPSCADVVGPNDLYHLAIVEASNGHRTFSVGFRGDAVQHYPLSGGLTFTSGNAPRPRNTTFSAGQIEIQLLGYFIKGDALDSAEPRF